MALPARPLTELALFAGAGDGLLGSALLGWQPICAVEIDPYCREVLLRRQLDGLLPLFPIWDNVTQFDGNPWRGKVDILTGGFPCQPFSSAGRRLGVEDKRNCWPDTLRILREVQPVRALFENVPRLLVSGYFTTILRDLAASGYDARWQVVSANSVGAPHLRKRLWIVADANSPRQSQYSWSLCNIK